MYSTSRVLVVALALVTIVCFYYQISDLPHLKSILYHTPQEESHASTLPTSGDDSYSRSAPGFHGSHSAGTTEDNQPESIFKVESLGEGSIGSRPPNDKAVVMGALSTDDVAWATTKLNGWDAFVYTPPCYLTQTATKAEKEMLT
jgi:hypothetical protein